MLDEWAGLAGKVAVVTGGAGGLGLPITLHLDRAGMAVAVCDRDPEAAAATTELLRDADTDAMVECFDVRQSSSLIAFFEHVDGRFGKIAERSLDKGSTLGIIRLAASHAFTEAAAVADTAYHAAGVDAVFAGNGFERRLRDIRTATQQFQGRDEHYETVGRSILRPSG